MPFGSDSASALHGRIRPEKGALLALEPTRVAAWRSAISARSSTGPVVEVTIVLTEASFASSAIGPIEVFRTANQHCEAQALGAPSLRVRTASIDGSTVSTMCSLDMNPEYAIEEIERSDLIILPASSMQARDIASQPDPITAWLRKCHREGSAVAAISSGAAVVAQSGLLDGRAAATHPVHVQTLRQRFPRVHWKPDLSFTEDERVFCSSGAHCASDLSLHLVERFCGREAMLYCAHTLPLDTELGRQAGSALSGRSRMHTDERIKATERYLREKIDQELSIDLLASRVAMGSRSFIRRFKESTGYAPGAYIQLARMSSAKEMLEHSALAVSVIASRVGYSDLAFFRQLFRRHTGMTPTEYRDRFGEMRFGRDPS